MRWRLWLAGALILVVPGLGSPAPEGPRYALALHGGAGVIPEDSPVDEIQAYTRGLEQALKTGQALLARGGTSLDAVEAVVKVLEDDPSFNAGKGAVYNHEGQHELDASLMDGSNLRCGAVAAVRTVKNPIALARLVMERSPHVLLAGEGAEEFARSQGMESVPNSYFDTPKRYQQWRKALEEDRIQRDHSKGTVGCVALDSRGNLAAATSTGGLTNKRHGRVGDTPIVGAGTYADNQSCAVSCTGTGEEFIRNVAAFQVAAGMRYGHLSLDEAVRVVLRERLKPDDGGLIAVDRQGHIVMDYTTSGMFRGAADSQGRFEVKIWR